MGIKDQQVILDKRGFITPITPIGAAGMQRFAVDLETLTNDILSGRRAWLRTLMTAPTQKTIASNAITPTLALHTVAASSGTTDTLNTITAVNNTWLVLKAASGHTITLASGAGNIITTNGGGIDLSGDRAVLLWCENSQWSVIAASGNKNNFTALVDPGSGDDSTAGYTIGSLWINTIKPRMWACVDNTAAAAIWKPISSLQNWGIRAAAATAQPVGIAAPTLSAGATGNANSASDTFLTVASTASSDPEGWVTASFDLIRPEHDPIIEIGIRTSSPITGTFYVGLTSANIASGTGSALPAGTKFIGFRLTSSTLKPVLCDGSTQTDGSGSAAAINTTYRLKMRIASALSTVYYSINDGAEEALTTGFPDEATDMGAVLRISGQNPVTAMTTLFSYLKVQW